MEQLSNFPVTTLSASITSSATTLSVTSATNFPTTGNFRILIENEIMKVTGLSGTTFTVVRGQEGTTAASHGSTKTVTAIVSKGSLEALLADTQQYGLFSARPSSAVQGTVWSDTDSQYQYVYNAGAWELINPLYMPAARQIDLSAWTGVNLTNTTWVTQNGVLHATSVDSGGGTLKLYHKSLPSPPYKLNTVVRVNHWWTTYFHAALALYNTVSGKIRLFQSATTNGGKAIVVEDWSSLTAGIGTSKNTKFITLPVLCYLQIEDDNTNWYFRFSADGLNWILLYQSTRNEFLTADKVAFVLNHNGAYGTLPRTADFFGYWEG